MASGRNAGLFLLLSFLWGTAFVAISAGLAYVPPVLFAGVRYDIAGLIMIVYAAVATELWRPRSRADWATVLIGSVLVIALYNAFLFIGQQGVTSGVAAILIAINPILATGFSRLLLPHGRLTIVGTIGLLVGFLGVLLVVAPDPSTLSSSSVVASGFVLFAAVSVALGSVLMQRVESDISTEGTVAWSCLLGAVLLHVMSAGLPSESLTDVEVTLGAAVAVGYLSLFASAIGYLIYFDLLDRLGAIEINLVSYTAPLFATVFGWALLGETITTRTVVGFVIICCGFVLIKHDAFATKLDRLRRAIGQ